MENPARWEGDSIITLAYVSIGESPSYLKTTVDGNAKFHPLGDTQVFFSGGKNKSGFDKISHLFRDDFWRYTAQRLFVLQGLMESDGLKDVVHIENDNLIYTDLNKLPFKEYANGAVLVGDIGRNYASAGIMYIPNAEALRKVNDAMIRIATERDITDLIKETQFNGVISEMFLLYQLAIDETTPIRFLPSHVCPETIKNVELFGGVFDPASYGQYIDGIPGRESVPYVGNHHWIGANINQGHHVPRLENGIPYMRDQELRRWPIFNLHIHSKRLEIFT